MDRVFGRQLAAPFQGHPNHNGDLPSLVVPIRDHNQALARLRYKLSGVLSQHNVPVNLQANIFDAAQLWYCFCTRSQHQVTGGSLNIVYQIFDPSNQRPQCTTQTLRVVMT